jgi:hypothetical protein
MSAAEMGILVVGGCVLFFAFVGCATLALVQPYLGRARSARTRSSR